MKYVWIVLSLAGLLAGTTVKAQYVDLPRISPKAAVSYTIGMTEVNITYGAPAVNNRVIWGGVVPYGEVWRAGANEATTVEFSTDVNMEGQTLRAGKYALFFIPGEKEWTVILNKKYDQWGAFKYDESEDAIRFTVEPKMNEGMQERLMYSIHDMKVDMGYIKLSWEKMRLYLRFKVDVMTQSMANIYKALETTPEENKWIVYAQSAQFMADADANLDQALDWAEEATKRKETSWTWYVKARIQAAKGDMLSAVTSGTKAAEAGLADPADPYYKEHRDEINASIQSWASKMN